MAFENYNTTQSEARKSNVDWDALNKYTVETADLKEKTVLTGIIVGIVDVGIQNREDAEVPFVGTEEDEATLIAEKPQTYFKDGIDFKTQKPVRYKCWPQTPLRSVAVAVDFPDVMLNKGQFFDKTNTELKPLRMWLGGEYWNGTMKVLQRPVAFKVGKDIKGRWTFDKKHPFHQMAVASKLIGADDVFRPEHAEQLIGKPFQFEVQVYLNESKGKFYLNEKIAYKTGLSRGQVAPELPTETFIVEFDKENDEETLKQLRPHIVNTIRNAKNYSGSPIEKQLEAIKSSYSSPKDDDSSSDDTPAEAPKAEVKKPTVRRATPKVEEADDPDIPF